MPGKPKIVIFASILSVGLVLSLSLFIFSQTAPEAKKSPSKLERIKASGQLIVGTTADYPPYEFHLLNDKEGEIVGLDIDIARAIADELKVKLEIKDIKFSDLFKALQDETIDLAVAGLSPTEKRREIANFSDEYYQAIQNLVIRAEDASEIHQLEDLRGKKVGVQIDSIQEEMARTQILGADFVPRDTIGELIADLNNGVTDAVILEKPVADTYVAKDKKLLSQEGQSDRMPLGSAIAVKKGHCDLLSEVNRILEKLKKENKIAEFIEDAKMLSNKR